MKMTIDEALTQGGAGKFQRKLLGIFGLVWAADAMQVIAVGFSAASIAASFGLTVPQALQTGTLFFLGMFIGATLFGRLADRYGRRRVLILTVACDAIFGLLSVFAPSFGVLLGLRFLTGVAVGGTLPVDYAMMAEFLPPRNRGRWLVWLEGFWAVGTIIVALTAWLAASAGSTEAWRWIFAVAAVPALIGIWLRLWVPESPMFLLKSGDEPGARKVVAQVLQNNDAPPLPAEARLVLPQVTRTDGLFDGAMRGLTIAVLALWFLVSLSYYGVFTWLPPRLATDGFGFVRGYGFLVILALAQIPGYALAAHGVERWGRRPTLIGFLLLSACACLLFTLAPSPTVIAISLILMSFALLGTWGALYAFTPELYPTHLRGTGMGMASAFARLGGLCAPFILPAIVAQGFGLTIGLFAALLFLAALVAVTIRVETRDRPIG
ncbi:MFS transporter [Paracoccus pacificus]|uniref:MFS transporter n=1 Tax=Paracoccus pacificus TaxID=1463598 RepID=A0ABW4R3I1_9RHOB